MTRRVLSVPALLAALQLAGPPRAGAAPADDAIREEEIRATVEFLSSPDLGGRGAAEQGGAVTSAYVVSRLKAIGWLPCGDPRPSQERSWFQSVPALQGTYDRAGSSVVLARTARATDAHPSSETLFDGAAPGFRTTPDRALTVEITAGLVFAGFGIRAPEHGRDDYAGIDPGGKIVVTLSGEPREQDDKSPWAGARPTRHAPISSKRTLAASLGAVALLVVPNPAGRARSADDLRRAGGPEPGEVWIGLRDRTPAIPLVYLDFQAAERLLGGLDLRSISSDLEQGRGASRTIEGSAVTVRLAYRDRKEILLRNVLARLGSGRGLEGEVVLLGAHWDHLGSPGGVVHPGADDNASGIAGLLAAAAALRASPPRGAREVILGAWTGEEGGRLGSTYFTENPPVPLSRIATALNLDMLGRNNMDRPDHANVLQLIYAAGAPVLREIALRANEEVRFDLRFHGSLRFRPVSDHATFFDAGIPVVYPFSGYHDDYHKPTDTPDRVSAERIARAARYVARLVRLLAEHEGAIRLDPSIREAPPPDPFPTPYGG